MQPLHNHGLMIETEFNTNLGDFSLRINGSPTKSNFNANGILDLRTATKRNVRKQFGATFLYIEFYDLSNLPQNFENDPQFWNLAIRAEQMDSARVDEMMSHFEQNGFMLDFPFPCVGTDGRFRDGRARITAAKYLGERWIPVAVYEYEDNSNRAYINNGLMSNDHPPSKRASMNDFEVAGIELCCLGELSPNKDHIDRWLYDEVGILKWFDNDKSGTVSKIRNRIIDGYHARSEGKTSLIRKKDRKGWEKWCHVNGYELSDRRILESTDQYTYIIRTFEKIMIAASMGLDPIEIILYTNKDASADQIARDMKSYARRLEELYKEAHTMCSSIPHKTYRPWKILGAIPQVFGRHQVESNVLVDISSY